MPLATEEEVHEYMKQNPGREFHPASLSVRFDMSQQTLMIRLNSLTRKGLIKERYISAQTRMFQVPEAVPRAPAANRTIPEFRPLNNAYQLALRRQLQLCRERALT